MDRTKKLSNEKLINFYVWLDFVCKKNLNINKAIDFQASKHQRNDEAISEVKEFADETLLPSSDNDLKKHFKSEGLANALWRYANSSTCELRRWEKTKKSLHETEVEITWAYENSELLRLSKLDLGFFFLLVSLTFQDFLGMFSQWGDLNCLEIDTLLRITRRKHSNAFEFVREKALYWAQMEKAYFESF